MNLKRFEYKKHNKLSTIAKVFYHPELRLQCPVCRVLTGHTKTYYSIHQLHYHFSTIHQDELCDSEYDDFTSIFKTIRYAIKLGVLRE